MIRLNFSIVTVAINSLGLPTRRRRTRRRSAAPLDAAQGRVGRRNGHGARDRIQWLCPPHRMWHFAPANQRSLGGGQKSATRSGTNEFERDQAAVTSEGTSRFTPTLRAATTIDAQASLGSGTPRALRFARAMRSGSPEKSRSPRQEASLPAGTNRDNAPCPRRRRARGRPVLGRRRARTCRWRTCAPAPSHRCR